MHEAFVYLFINLDIDIFIIKKNRGEDIFRFFLSISLLIAELNFKKEATQNKVIQQIDNIHFFDSTKQNETKNIYI